MNNVYSVEFSPDGKTIAYGEIGEGFKQRDITTGEILQTFKSSENVNSIAFSTDGKTLVSGGQVTTWDVTTGRMLRSFEKMLTYTESVAFSLDGSTVAFSSGNRIEILDARSGEILVLLMDHPHYVSALAFSLDGKILASASSDGTVCLRELALIGEYAQTLESYTDHVISVVFAPDGRLVASSSNDGTVRLWNTTGAALRTLHGDSRSSHSIVFSPDGSMLASGAEDGTVSLWDLKTRSRMVMKGHTLSERETGVRWVLFSPDGKILISCVDITDDIKLWDTLTGTALRSLEGHKGVNAMAISPNGKIIATGSGDNRVMLWDAANGAKIHTPPPRTDDRGLLYSSIIYSIAFSPDGSLVAYGTATYSVQLLNAATGAEVQEFKGHSHNIYSIAFSPDGNIIAATSDYMIIFWNVVSGEVIMTMELDIFIISMSFSASGYYLNTNRGIIDLRSILHQESSASSEQLICVARLDKR